MRKTYLPHYNQNKESESELHRYRVAHGFTVKELGKAANIDPGRIAGLANGMISPMYLRGTRAGKLKPWVERILKVLDAEPADLFPRYICSIRRKSNIERDAVTELIYSNMKLLAASPEEIIIKKEIACIILHALILHTPKQLRVFMDYCVEGYNFKEAGKRSGVSGNRAKQIFIATKWKVRKRVARKIPEVFADLRDSDLLF